jgi:hypothetical protein
MRGLIERRISTGPVLVQFRCVSFRDWAGNVSSFPRETTEPRRLTSS